MLNDVKEIPELAVQNAYEQFEATGTVSMRKLGASLDVSAAALYHHFANKQELLNAVADRAFGVFEKRLRSIEAREPHKVIHAILGEYRQFATDHRNLFGLMFLAPRPSARQFPRDFAAHRSAVFNLLWKAVEECVADSADGTSGEALYLAHDLWALTHGQILLWRAGRFEDDQTFERNLHTSIERFISTL